MSKIEISSAGTLGDTYILVLKLMQFGDVPIKVFHYTKHVNWYNQIREIYRLLPNIEVEFVKEPKKDLFRIESFDKKIPQVFFPKFDIDYEQIDLNDYVVVQCHAGKDNGGNTKRFNINYLNSLIHIADKVFYKKTVLIGTDKRYADIEGCLNLVGKTSISFLFSIIANADEFIGPEGLCSFIALSNRIKSTVFYTSYVAVETRIIETPWEEYCELRFLKEKLSW